MATVGVKGLRRRSGKSRSEAFGSSIIVHTIDYTSPCATRPDPARSRPSITRSATSLRPRLMPSAHLEENAGFM